MRPSDTRHDVEADSRRRLNRADHLREKAEERHQAEAASHVKTCDAMRKWRQRAEALEEALKPFADIAAALDACDWDERYSLAGDCDIQIDPHDVRRAQALLESQGAPDAE